MVLNDEVDHRDTETEHPAPEDELATAHFELQQSQRLALTGLGRVFFGLNVLKLFCGTPTPLAPPIGVGGPWKAVGPPKVPKFIAMHVFRMFGPFVCPKWDKRDSARIMLAGQREKTRATTMMWTGAYMRKDRPRLTRAGGMGHFPPWQKSSLAAHLY